MALRYTSPKKRRKAAVALRPVHPNVGIEVEYRRRLKKLIDAMQKSVAYHIERSYRGNEPEMAQDDRLPADNLQRAVWKMSEQWLQNFDDAAEKLAKWFAKAVHKRSDTVLKKILKDGGFSVEFQMTPAMKDVFAASVHENVSLIKSIPQQYLKNVEGDVMRSALGYPMQAELRDPVMARTFKFTDPDQVASTLIYNRTKGAGAYYAYGVFLRHMRQRFDRSIAAGGVVNTGVSAGAGIPIFYHLGDLNGLSSGGRPAFYGRVTVDADVKNELTYSDINITVEDEDPLGIDIAPSTY